MLKSTKEKLFLIFGFFIIFIYLNLDKFNSNNTKRNNIKTEENYRISQALNNEICPIPEMSEEVKREKLNSFIEKLNARHDNNEFISELEVVEKLESRSLISNMHKKEEVLPGEFSFGEDKELFHLILCYSADENYTKKAFAHEMEHYSVIKKYNLPADFRIVFSNGKNGFTAISPSVATSFPSNFTKEQIIKIHSEILEVTEERSEGDQNAINEYNKLLEKNE
ncbi:MAG: hypothetical protein KAT32_03980 [Candidatus Moranbacteria bacterium]|nr:hypothetical protein [Candidatus Moranbacteria bacterium]